MNFDPHGTLAGYARTSVNLRTRMVDYHRTRLSHDHITSFLASTPSAETPAAAPTREMVVATHYMTSKPWELGEPYIVAPAMTAIVAAAAEALDLAGETLPEDIAPDDAGIVFFPEPIYHRGLAGEVSGIGAITWTQFRTTSGDIGWAIFGWVDRHDSHDPSYARRRAILAERPDLAKKFGPYILTKYASLPIGQLIGPRPDLPFIEAADRTWEPAPDGRYCIDATTTQVHACVAIAYAFWCIQAQPLATVAPAPIDHRTTVRAQRASIKHDTRVVMLRRTSPVAEPTDGEPKWHYRVRFIVRGHWRRLIDRDGNPYRIWIHAHIKGPDGAPLLHGEKVSVLAR